MFLELIFLGVGLLGILLGAEIVVKFAQKIARAFHISEAFIGLTVLSIGTSLPEIFTHIMSSINILKGIDSAGIAVGTNIGSNIIQITFIMGIIALFTTVKSNKKILGFDYQIMLGAIFLLFLLSLNNFVSRFEGFILTAGYIYFLYYLSRGENIIETRKGIKRDVKDFLFLSFGIGILIFAANLVVKNATLLADLWGVSGSLIGTLLVGVATALPEFTTALIAIIRGSSGMSLGTLVGSNITNPMFALGIGAMISGYSIDNSILWFDIPFWFIISFVVMLLFKRSHRLNKKDAIFLIISYVAYVFIRLKFFSV